MPVFIDDFCGNTFRVCSRVVYFVAAQLQKKAVNRFRFTATFFDCVISSYSLLTFGREEIAQADSERVLVRTRRTR